MNSEYQQQRWQLHARIEEVRATLENLERQLEQIDTDLLSLNPAQSAAAKPIIPPAKPVEKSLDGQGTPLAIGAG